MSLKKCTAQEVIETGPGVLAVAYFAWFDADTGQANGAVRRLKRKLSEKGVQCISK